MAGRTISVPAGGSLQAAIDQAQRGDTILLQAGATYTGNFILKNKTGTGWIVIRSASPDGVLPRPGNRVGPQNAPVMAKVMTPNAMAAISADVGAHHYRLVGLEVTVDPSVAGVPNMILFENTSMFAVTNATPTDMVVDRCYIHGNPTEQLTRRGVAMMGARMAVIDSYIAEMHDSADSQAVAGWGGPGPYKIVNNYLEGAAENIFFFGYANMPVEMIPSDIEICGNYVRKPLKWKAGDPSFAGVRWPIKNLLEFKTARRVLIDGNIFENNWVGADQQGFAILISCNADAGTNCRNEDITFSNNIVRNATQGMNIVGHNLSTGSMDRVLVRNNVFENISGVLTQVMIRANEVTIEHNMAFHGSHPLFVGGEANQNFVYRNNIAMYATSGMYVNYMGSGTPNLAVMTPPSTTLDARITNNVLVNNQGLGSFAAHPGVTWYPGLDAVGFVDRAAGNYRLAPASAYKNAGTDGKDIGTDMDALQAATRSVISGAAGTGTQPADTTSPVITAVNAGSVASTGTTINWTTNEPADAQVEYGATTAYGAMSARIASLTTGHAIALTGLQPSTTYQYRVRSRDAAGNLAISTNASFTTAAAAPSAFTPIRVNAGGGAYTDPAGQVWSADKGYVAGITYSTTAAIANTTTAQLYQTHRWNYGTLQYRFSVPNGTYTVKLKFAEATYTAPGRRVFNIALNGQTVQTNFDPLAAAGAAYRAVDRSYVVNAITGQVALDLTAVIDHPEVNAIEITAGASTTPPPATGFTAIRVNAGGGGYTEPSGQIWSADKGYVAGITYSTTAAIANTTTAPLYQTNRWNYGPLQYRFSVPNGTYTVKLKFAEATYTAPGRRVFNIVLNGQTTQANFDPVAAAGAAYTAVDRLYTVNVMNGQIAVDITPVVDNPEVSAIEITAAL